MAVLLQIKNAYKSYGTQVLLEGADATVTDDEKVGFVGRNGAGKSTLLKILLGDEELDKGEIIRHPRLQLGYLRQHDPFQPGETSIEFLMRDSGQPDWKCGEVAGQFELKGPYLEGPVASLSGGWQTRLKLAALLLHEPNLLLLDEPTNFLDLRTQILLEHFLKEHRSACLVVSHDRAFLKSTCTKTLDLSAGKLTTFPGPIDAFLEYQQERIEHDRRVNATTLAKRRDLEEFIAKNKARASTATRAKSKSKQLEKLELLDIPADEPTAKIRPPQVEPRKGPVLRCIDLAIGYGDRRIASGVDLEIEHGSRAAIVGDNGQGKTTFLRTVVDSLPALAGEAKWGYATRLGVYAQHVYTSLTETGTVLDYLHNKAEGGTTDQAVLDMAGALLFRGDAVRKKIAVLSGGERARLCLAGLLLGKYTVLVLDEPGNHLDVDTIEALSEALKEYKGTVVFTSHDRHFVKSIATCVIEVRDGGVTNYRGGYDAYLYAVEKEISEGERERDAKLAKTPAAAGKGPAKAVAVAKAPARSEREIRKEMSNVERTIARLDGEKKKLEAQYLSTRDAAEATKLHAETASLAAQLTEAEERWLVLQQELGDFE
ncbi:MAG TPA: ABC-F family ATP-binding cassette domain-containing protein [Pirellulaceae bacterium]|nr:ABC-F family ATP-binding cassette domain-containing protein [Pirellulaceae bacterium]